MSGTRRAAVRVQTFVRRSWLRIALLLVLMLAPASSAAGRERTIRLPGPPTDVVYAAGSVWVTVDNRGALLRLDPASGRVLSRIPLPAVSDYSQIALANGSVWVTDSGRGVVYRVDPRARGIVATIRLHLPALGIAAGAGSLWVTAPRQAHGTVFRIDPRTNRVVRRLRAGTGPGPIAFAGGSVWLIDTSLPYAGLQRIDPATDRYREPPAGLGGAINVPLAGTSRYLWLAGDRDRYLRYDSRTGKVAVVRLRGAKGAIAFAVGPHVVWAAHYRDSTLTRIAYR